jgi:hypothetical protein
VDTEILNQLAQRILESDTVGGAAAAGSEEQQVTWVVSPSETEGGLFQFSAAIGAGGGASDAR